MQPDGAEDKQQPARGPVNPIAAASRWCLIALVRLYQHTLGAVLPDACRFTPTCSVYFIEAVRRHGAIKGAWLGVRRLLRCHPYCAGGHDPVP